MNQIKTIGAFIIASAVIWGAAILTCSYKLKGTECYDEISTVLGAAAAIHLIFIWGPLSALFMKSRGSIKQKENKNEDSSGE